MMKSIFVALGQWYNADIMAARTLSSSSMNVRGTGRRYAQTDHSTWQAHESFGAMLFLLLKTFVLVEYFLSGFSFVENRWSGRLEMVERLTRGFLFLRTYLSEQIVVIAWSIWAPLWHLELLNRPESWFIYSGGARRDIPELVWHITRTLKRKKGSDNVAVALLSASEVVLGRWKWPYLLSSKGVCQYQSSCDVLLKHMLHEFSTVAHLSMNVVQPGPQSAETTQPTDWMKDETFPVTKHARRTTRGSPPATTGCHHTTLHWNPMLSRRWMR